MKQEVEVRHQRTFPFLKFPKAFSLYQTQQTLKNLCRRQKTRDLPRPVSKTEDDEENLNLCLFFGGYVQCIQAKMTGVIKEEHYLLFTDHSSEHWSKIVYNLESNAIFVLGFPLAVHFI